MHTLCSAQQQTAFREDGVVFLPNVFSDWVTALRQGIDDNLENPGPYFADNSQDGEGRFWDDYCNWPRIPAFKDFIENSPVGKLASQLMQSQSVQVFHEHVLVKEPNTKTGTPWHQDSPYYFVDGQQTISFWIPLDTVSRDTSLQFLAGSHRWEKDILPVSWADNSDFYAADQEQYTHIPDPSSKLYQDKLRVWTMQPGDAVAFHYRTAHGAAGNLLPNRRRAFSLRLLGDDTRYIERPGRTSPPFPDHNMQAGQKLREDWFPTIFESSASNTL